MDPDRDHPLEQLRRVRVHRPDDTQPLPVYQDQPAPRRTRPVALAAAALGGVALGLLAGARQSPLQSVPSSRSQRVPAPVRPTTGTSGQAGTPVPAAPAPVGPPEPGAANSTETGGSQTGVDAAGPAGRRPGRHGADGTHPRRGGPLPPGRPDAGTTDLGDTSTPG